MARILIVEDSPTQAERLKLILEAESFDAEVAVDAEAALARLASCSFSLVISDINMPGMSGYELCRRIKMEPKWKDIPVILLTARNDPMDIFHGLECGADNFYTKPYDPDRLIERIRNILYNRALRQEGRLKVGIEVALFGKTFTVGSDREQILDLLISTFEDIVLTNTELEKSRLELAAAKVKLEEYARLLERRVELSEDLHRQSETHFRNLVEGSIQGILVMRENALFANEAFCRMFGYTFDEVLSASSIYDFYHPSDRARFKAYFGQKDGEISRGVYEFRGLRKDGSSFWLEQLASVVEWHGSPATQVVIIDITERKAAELALSEREMRYRVTFENAPVAMCWIAPDGRIIETNGAFQRMFGYGPEEHKNTMLLDLVDPGFRSQAQPMFATLWNATDDQVDVEQRLCHKDGHTIWALVSANVICSDEKQPLHIICHLQDITERKSTEEQLFQLQKMEALGNLAGGIAHDFNNMLLPIRILTKMVLDELPSDSPNRENLSSVLEAADSAANLVKQILTFSRHDESEFVTLDISKCIQEALRLLSNVLPSTITVVDLVADNIGAVIGNDAHLQSVIMNLGSNAAHAIDSKVGELRIGLTRVLSGSRLSSEVRGILEGQPYAKIVVQDTGCGMDQETLSKIFDPFFTTKEVGEGTGLGLAMVHGIVNRHGGAIGVKSQIGVGTTFEIYLPLASQSTECAIPPDLARAGAQCPESTQRNKMV